jgi:hypothetical protein
VRGIDTLPCVWDRSDSHVLSATLDRPTTDNTITVLAPATRN